MSDADIVDTVHMLRRFYAKMGIMEIPDDEILLVLIDSIRSVIGNWRISEVEYAFDLGLKGTVDIDTNLYNKPLNIVFLSNLMNAYRVFIRPAIQKQKNTVKERVYTDQEKEEIKINNIKGSFDFYKKGGFLLNGGNTVYRALEDKINVEDSMLRSRAEMIHKERKRTKMDRSQYKTILLETLKRAEEGNYNKPDEEEIERIMCDLRLEKYFDQIIEMDMNITDML